MIRGSMPAFCIGALGGSGTRMVAELFLRVGVFMGYQRNIANDCLDFTQLVNMADIDTIPAQLQLFVRYMNTRARPVSDRIRLWRQFIQRYQRTLPQQATRDAAWRWHMRDFLKEQTGIIDKTPSQYWGWKEPNTHIILPHIMMHFPQTQYIHIIRHGLDMAFSQNHNQLARWGWIYGIPYSVDLSDTTRAMRQLDYWIITTRRIMQLADYYPGRIKIFQLEAFWQEPVPTIRSCFAHAGIPITDAQLADVVTIPQNKHGDYRYRQHDISIFRPDQLEAVQALGYSIT